MTRRLAFFSLSLLAACTLARADGALYSGVPENASDRSVAAFSDLGAWFGFALPDESRPDLAGAFVGPLLFDEGTWASEALLRPAVTLDGERIDLAAARTSIESPPGRLLQTFDVPGMRIAFNLFYEDAAQAVVQVHAYNSSRETRSLKIDWEIDADALVSTGINVLAPPLDVRIGPREPRFTEAHIALDKAVVSYDRRESDEARRKRWNLYLAKTATGQRPGHPRQVVAQKALMTLISNWRSPRGSLATDGLFPSSAESCCYGFRAWDSWKHAAAIARFDTHLAKQQIRTMYEHQDEHGMIADVVYVDPSQDNWRNSKPPLSAWAMYEVLEYGLDDGFLGEMYPQLVRYHEWWYRDRDHDGDGLAEYGSTDGTLEAAKRESGMDNAVRFDTAKLLKNSDEAWSMDQESVDLNAYLYREKRLLAEFAELLGKEDDAARWNAAATTLAEKIRTDMFDGERGWFSDISIDGEHFIEAEGPEGWIPLWAGVATQGQAERVRDRMMNPDKFRTPVPLPTVSRDHPEFSDAYWRGLVWIDQAWFGIEGLRRYGFESDARDLAEQLIASLDGATEPGEPLRENYHPLTGEGRNAEHFSWTAAHLLLLVLDLRNAAEPQSVRRSADGS